MNPRIIISTDSISNLPSISGCEKWMPEIDKLLDLKNLEKTEKRYLNEIIFYLDALTRAEDSEEVKNFKDAIVNRISSLTGKDSFSGLNQLKKELNELQILEEYTHRQ